MKIFSRQSGFTRMMFLEEFDEHFYRKLLSREKVVAVGECGLDYYRGFQSLRFKVQEHQATNNREPRTGNEEGSQSRSQSSTAVGSLTSAPTTGSLTSASAGTLEEIKQEQKKFSESILISRLNTTSR